MSRPSRILRRSPGARALFKMLIGFCLGLVLTGALFLGPLKPSSTRAEDGDSPVSGNITAEGLSALDFKLMLNTAAQDIQTDDTRQYYQKLMSSYGIDEFPTPTEETLDTNPVGLLPDMQRINNSAIRGPLEEAGRQIRDPDIARFYYKLLNDAGWNISQDSP